MVAEAVRLQFVAVSGDRKPHLAPDQVGIIERHHSGIVSVFTDLMRRGHPDQWNRTLGRRVDDPQCERAVRQR
ncbi:MAG: hypothetical protein QM755_06595 [Luteolibacter sp.]